MELRKELDEIMTMRISLLEGMTSLEEFENTLKRVQEKEASFTSSLPLDAVRYQEGLNFLKKESNRLKKEIKRANRCELFENVSLLTKRLNIVREKTRKSIFWKKTSATSDY